MASKSQTRSLSLKEKGNACFRERKTAAALKFYTSAILSAPWPIREQRKRVEYLLTLSPQSVPRLDASNETTLAVCFGNRSAALYELGRHKECLQDIESALKLGVSAAIKEKLLRRRESCLSRLEQRNSEIQDEEQPLCNVYESKCVSVEESQECGRFLEATAIIRAGEVIATEDPFACVLDEQYTLTHCSCCFKHTPSILPCYWCTGEGYCSEQCLNKAWMSHHWMECERASRLAALGSLAQLCLRTATQSSSEMYETVYSLVTHESETLKDSSQRKSVEEMAHLLADMFGEAMKKGSVSPDKLFLHHLLQLRCNTHMVSAVVTSPSDQTPQSEERSGDSVVRKHEAKLGSVLYPTLSLVNHSCRPNAILRFEGNRASLCATKLIRAGEEVNISYGPQAGRSSRAQRQTELKSKYFFDCTCTACKNPCEVQDCLLCPKCLSGPLVRNQTTLSCFDCEHTPPVSEVTRLSEMRKKASEMYREAVETEPYDLQVLTECQKLQNKVLHRDNMELGSTHDAMAQAYAVRGDFALSARYCALSCEAVGVAYGEGSIELGNELFKLAQLEFNSGNLVDALEAAKKARDILSIYQGQNHPDCLELTDLIKNM